MSASQFLQSDKKLADLTRMELYHLLADEYISAWLYDKVQEELCRRI